MKTLLLFPICAVFAQTVMAQEPPPMDAPPPPPPGRGEKGNKRPPIREHLREHFLKDLSEQDRKRFEAARNQAMQDPSIAALRDKAESANREFFEAVRARIQQIDPGLEEVIKKAMANKARDGRPGKKDGKGPEGGLGSLSETERQKLMAAREIAKSTPAVQQAEAQREAAKTPDEKRAAGEAYGKAMRDAILTADPSLKDVLDKVHTPRRQGPSGPPPRAGAGPSPRQS